MKSIIEEAPSILKAIEKAWARAGNPREFSVKIFEDAQKSFFGLTTAKQAKVGVFFEIEPIQTDSHKPESHKQHMQPQPRTKEEPRHHKKPMHQSYREDDAVPFVPHQPTGQEHAAPAHEHKKQRISWNDEMLTAVSTWLKELLTISDLDSQQPTLTVLDNRLIILFEKPLFDDPAKSSDLYRSLSYLLIGMVRSKFKKDFRFLKVVLTDGQRDRGNEYRDIES
jgi:predicted RNA-binding protein Jag